jgi:hypothetical protein
MNEVDMPETINALMETLCPEYERYTQSPDVVAETEKTDEPADYGRLSSLYDTLLQQIALKTLEEKDNSRAPCHMLFHVLMHELLKFQKSFEASNTDQSLKTAAFHQQKYSLLQRILGSTLDDLKAIEYESKRAPTTAASTPAKTGVCVFINGTEKHNFLESENLTQTVARELPAFSLSFNGPTTTGKGGKSAASMSVGDSARAVGVVTAWFRKNNPTYMQHLDVSGYSRGAVAASRALGLEKIRKDSAPDEAPITYSSMQIDPVAATGNPRASGGGRTEDLSTAYQLPEHTRLLQLRMAHENSVGYAPFGGERMRVGATASTYSPFMPPCRENPTPTSIGHAAAEYSASGGGSGSGHETDSAITIIALPGMHKSAVSYCPSANDKEARQTQTLDLGLSYLREHFSNVGFLNPSQDYTFATPKVKQRKMNGQSIPKRMGAPHDSPGLNLRLTHYMSIKQHVVQQGDYRRGQNTGFFKRQLYGPKGDRYEKKTIARYGVGRYRFVNRQHFELFQSHFPQLANLLNPQRPLEPLTYNTEQLQAEIIKLHTEYAAHKNPLVKQDIEGLLHTVNELNLTDVPIDVSQLENDESQRPSKDGPSLRQAKAKLTQATQAYVHKNWGARNNYWWKGAHSGKGMHRALDLERAISNASSKGELLQLLRKTFTGGGNWKKDSLKTHLLTACVELEEKNVCITKGNVGQYKHYKTQATSQGNLSGHMGKHALDSGLMRATSRRSSRAGG